MQDKKEIPRPRYWGLTGGVEDPVESLTKQIERLKAEIHLIKHHLKIDDIVGEEGGSNTPSSRLESFSDFDPPEGQEPKIPTPDDMYKSKNIESEEGESNVSENGSEQWEREGGEDSHNPSVEKNPEAIESQQVESCEGGGCEELCAEQSQKKEEKYEGDYKDDKAIEDFIVAGIMRNKSLSSIARGFSTEEKGSNGKTMTTRQWRILVTNVRNIFRSI